MQPRRHQGRAVRAENAWDARRRGQVDVALLSVLTDGLLRRSKASELRRGEVELQEDGSARIHVRRSKTDPEAEGAVLYIGPDSAAALVAIMPDGFAVAGPVNADIWALCQPDRPQGQRRGEGGGAGRRLHRPQRGGVHGPGSGGRRGGAAGADDRRQVEELQDAGAVHRRPGCGPRGGGQLLPEERGLMLQQAAESVGSSPSWWASLDGRQYRLCTTFCLAVVRHRTPH